MRVLVVGAFGQLGHALVGVFGAKCDVVPAGFRRAAAGQLVLDLGDPASVDAALAKTKPDVVVIAGAQCNVDRCESETAEGTRINVDGPRSIARYARERDTTVVYYSTDHVFDGSRPRHAETDAIAPVNAYARSKAAGEAAIRELLPGRHVILRTSWLYGPDAARRNFALRLVDALRRGDTVRVPSDQSGCPTYTGDLAAATFALIERGHAGTFHACGPDVVDRVTLARRICARYGLPETGLAPVPTAELKQAAPRPRRVVLDCAKLQGTIDVTFRGVDAGLAALAAADGGR
jgi:dTDP-4-dehydrorhamnose reductase